LREEHFRRKGRDDRLIANIEGELERNKIPFIRNVTTANKSKFYVDYIIQDKIKMLAKTQEKEFMIKTWNHILE